MRAAGFWDVSWTPYTFGIAGLYRGKKAAPAERWVAQRRGRRHTDCGQARKHRAAYVVPTGRRN